MSIIHHCFEPAWWLNNPHLQTVYPALLRKPPTLMRKRQRLFTEDGDFIDLDWYGDDDRAIVILLHGLAGSSQSGYILGLQHVLKQHGFSSVAMNFRGCSGEPNRLARSYHSGETEDIEFVYQSLRQQFPKSALAAVGFSLGGNVLLKWLGEQGCKVKLFAAAAICVPLVLSACATRLDHGVSRLYRGYLLNELKRYIEIKKRHLLTKGWVTEAEKLIQLGDLSSVQSFWQYDDLVVARLHDFKDVNDYYRRASSRQFLPKIRVPSLLIQARDDPFMTPDVLPSVDELSSAVELEICSNGGHVGFIEKWRGFGHCYWLEKRIPAFLGDKLKN